VAQHLSGCASGGKRLREGEEVPHWKIGSSLVAVQFFRMGKPCEASTSWQTQKTLLSVRHSLARSTKRISCTTTSTWPTASPPSATQNSDKNQIYNATAMQIGKFCVVDALAWLLVPSEHATQTKNFCVAVALQHCSFAEFCVANWWCGRRFQPHGREQSMPCVWETHIVRRLRSAHREANKQ
jgi:hypothetical protein